MVEPAIILNPSTKTFFETFKVLEPYRIVCPRRNLLQASLTHSQRNTEELNVWFSIRLHSLATEVFATYYTTCTKIGPMVDYKT